MRVLVFGGSGLVGSKFIEINNQTFEIKAPLTGDVDILNKDQVLKITQDFNPDAIINFAAYTKVEEAEAQKGDRDGIVFQINSMGAKNIAEVCKSFNKYLIHISTEYVFDGTKADAPYVEENIPNPINWYGATKYFGEQFVLESGCEASIVRLSMPYSAFFEPKSDIARFFLGELQMGQPVKAVTDQRITPTLVSDIVHALKVLIQNKSLGIYHVSSKDSVTPLEFAKNIAEIFQLNITLISSISLAEYNQNKKAKLLKYSWLSPAKFEREFNSEILHTVAEGLRIFKQEIDYVHETERS